MPPHRVPVRRLSAPYQLLRLVGKDHTSLSLATSSRRRVSPPITLALTAPDVVPAAHTGVREAPAAGVMLAALRAPGAGALVPLLPTGTSMGHLQRDALSILYIGVLMPLRDSGRLPQHPAVRVAPQLPGAMRGTPLGGERATSDSRGPCRGGTCVQATSSVPLRA